MFWNVIKNILKVVLAVLLIAISLTIGFFLFINLPVFNSPNDAELGVTFSARYAHDIGLDWKQAYVATLDDLKVRKIRIPVYWDLAEPQEGTFDFSDLDWQLAEAQKRNAEVILVVGQKVPRWPECFIPDWIKNDDQKRKAVLLKFIDQAVSHFKNDQALKYWQVENEPFLSFGICPALDTNLLDNEIALVRLKDPSRKVIVTDSGELSLWTQAASRADIFGTTMYRTIFKQGWGYYEYPIGPRFFQLKYWLNRYLAHQNNAIVIELQGEPWIQGWTTDAALSEQFKSMNPGQLQSNVQFAENVGFPQIYIWGVEWWYWLKVNQNHPEMWNMAKILFHSDSVL